MKAAKKLLESFNVRASYHRVRILYHLMHTHDHPTAEMIYQALLEDTHSISKVTVYNTLNLLQDLGIVKPLDLSGEETRYDIETSTHAHFQCKQCKRIFDAVLDKDLNPDNLKFKGEVDDIQVLIKGTCEDCLSGRKQARQTIKSSRSPITYFLKESEDEDKKKRKKKVNLS